MVLDFSVRDIIHKITFKCIHAVLPDAKKSVLLLAVLLLAGTAFAQTEADFTMELTMDLTGAVITGYKGKAKAVQIPAAIRGMPVTAIGGKAFSGARITSVIIPEGVNSIGAYAFYGCRALRQVSLPDGLTMIYPGAFSECASLRTITLPDSLSGLFSERFNLLNYTGVFANSGLRSITLPKGITEIYPTTFYGCRALRQISLPDGLTEIGRGAFEGCSALTSVTIPEGLTVIGSGAFEGCSALASLNLPSTLKEIHRNAFSGCKNLTSVNIPDSVSNIDFDESAVFDGCSKIPPAQQAALRKRGYTGDF